MTTRRLKDAQAAVNQVRQELAGLNIELSRIESNAQPAIQAAENVGALKRSLRQKLSDMLRLGRVDTSNNEIQSLSKQIDSNSHIEVAARELIAAKQTAVAEVHTKAVQLTRQLQDLQSELFCAQLDAAGIEINEELIPQMRLAAEGFRKALSALVGAGVAHARMAQEARSKCGIGVNSIGIEHPLRILDIHVVGFGISDTGHYNTLRLDMTESITQDAETARSRWTAE